MKFQRLHFNLKSFLLNEYTPVLKDSNTDDIRGIIGEPEYIESYGTNKIYHYSNYRFSFVNEKLLSIDIIFLLEDINYQIELTPEVINVNSGTSIVSFLKILNRLNIEWQISSKQSQLDSILINIKNSVFVFYNVDIEKIDRISIIYYT
jgi:hypothetical protein